MALKPNRDKNVKSAILKTSFTRRAA